ncbi:phage integrase [Methylomicrobium lacus]|uniref:phage integrase n=1 Tax=Methylomicrobium lacus TaxID=136992 RepID=UPI003CCC352D
MPNQSPPHTSKKGIKQETYRLQSLKKALGHLIVASIQSKHIVTYRNVRLKDGKSGTTVLHELSYLSQIFDVALKDWGIPRKRSTVPPIK